MQSLFRRLVRRATIELSGEPRRSWYHSGVAPELFSIDRNGDVHFNELGITAPRAVADDFLIDGYHEARELVQRAGASLKMAGAALEVTINGVSYLVQTAEDLYILREIHVAGVYNYRFSKPHVVLDIGMNVGFASLYFASRPEVQRVIAFEPFAPTYAQALTNLGRNPAIAARILPQPFGLGVASSELRVPYSYKLKGSVGVHSLSPHVIADPTLHEETARIEPVTVLDDLLRDCPDLPLGVKMDCEGAEYDILPLLCSSPVIDRVEWMLIEWHFNGAGALIEELDRKCFTTLSLDPSGRTAGMIYAFRQA